MREIKFRAWDKKFGWYHFSLAPRASAMDIYNDFERLCQYTGLKDKNGKEIYEGDVVRWGDFDGLKQKVEWNPHKGAWSGCEQSGACSETLWLPETCEIIGNIYENPELLENKS